MPQFKLVPRKEGDPPLDDATADAIRKAGFDPARFTLAAATGDLAGALASTLPQAGKRVRHNFRFPTLNGAFAAIERVLDDDLVVTLKKNASGYLVAFDAAATADDVAVHAALAERVADLGGEDAGSVRETIAVNTRVFGRDGRTG